MSKYDFINEHAFSDEDRPTPGVYELMADKKKLSRGETALKFSIVAAGLVSAGALAVTVGIETCNALLPYLSDMPSSYKKTDYAISFGHTGLAAACATMVALTRPIVGTARLVADYIVPKTTPEFDTWADNATKKTTIATVATAYFTGALGACSTLDAVELSAYNPESSKLMLDIFMVNAATTAATIGAYFAIESKAGTYPKENASMGTLPVTAHKPLHCYTA